MIDDLQNMFNNQQPLTKAEFEREIKALVNLDTLLEERVKKTLICFANILSDIPGCRETDKQKKYWKLLEERLK